jgi:DNA-binding response OmpR family regulator
MQQLDDVVVTRNHAPSRPPAPAQAASRKVLVVHRDASYRRTLAAYLTTQGFEPIARESGREALRDAGEIAPDAIMMDLDGDEYDEFELLACLASLPRRVPVIVCTPYESSHGPEQTVLRELGVRQVLPRPCRFELIVRALRELHPDPANMEAIK